MPAIRPFEVAISDETLLRIQQRVSEYPWHEMPDLDGWQYGTNHRYLRELCNYWLEEFDWRSHEQEINRFPHFKADVDGLEMHFIHERGSGDNPRPLLISHGWPGSVLEFKHIIEPLAHPERFGGKVEDAFDVIAPSLPGFGFSAKPPRPMGPRAMAKVLDTLMTDVLGYEDYIAQGGDWGGAVCSWLGYEHTACKAIHINILTMRHKDGPQGAEEIAWARQFDVDQIMQDGYRTQQATKPQSLGYAMMDSPVGVAAWIVEKFHAWSDLDNDNIESVHSKDDMLANIMVYLVTSSFNSATWIYTGRREEGGRLMSTEGKRVEVPVAAAVFPAEMLAWPPRSYVERIYNIQHWTEFARGGHFAAMEQPEALVQDIQAFARTL